MAILAFHIMGKSALETTIDAYMDRTIVRIFPMNGAQGTNLACVDFKPGDELCCSAFSLPDTVCKYAVKSRDTLS